ncbi:MAG: PTS sugar transporter subunit IIA [Gemmatimonadales bacterium]
MSDDLHGVVVAHGAIAPALVESVEEITGVRGVLVPVSNSGCDRGRLEERILAAVGDRRAVVFVDMPSGSCLFAAARRLASHPGVKLVTGVNLAMLVDFVFHRDLSVELAAERAADTGSRAISQR